MNSEKELFDISYEEYIKKWKDTHNEGSYVSKNEFFDNEYQDKEIMKEYLSPELYEIYLKVRWSND